MPTIDHIDADAAPMILWCLEHLDELADRFSEQLMLIDGYEHVDIEPQELRDTAHDAIGLILRRAAGLPLGERLSGVSEAIGRRRATQGVPLEVLLQGTRMTFRMLWVTMHDRATASQRAALGRSVVGLWSAIEFHTVRVHAGYLDEAARMRQHREAELTMLLSSFLDDVKPSGALTLRVGRTLGLLLDDAVLVGAVSLTDVAEVRRRLDRTSAQVHARLDSAVILLAGDIDPDALAARLDGIPLALAPVTDGLSGVPQAWAIAHALLVSAPLGARQPRTLPEGWPHLITVLMPEVSDTISARARAGLLEVSPEIRAQLVTTVETHLRTGSLAKTSQLLFCHRNTVLKRLSRFRALTGLDPSIPWDAATIRLVLAALD